MITQSVLPIFAALAVVLALPAAPSAAQDASQNDEAEALVSDAYGVSVETDMLNGMAEVVRAGPVPEVRVEMPPQADEEVATLAQVGPVPATGELVGYVRNLRVRAGGELSAGSAHAVAETEAVELLDGAITADALRAVSTTTCPQAGTPEEASDGSAFANLVIGGQEIDATPPPNTTISLSQGGQGIAEVVVREVVPDDDALGWTVRALRVSTLDPVTGLVNAEIIVGEAHSSLVCTGEISPPADEDRPDLRIDKEPSIDSAQPGETLSYDISVANTAEHACTIWRVTDHLPRGFTFVEAGGDFAEADANVEGRSVHLRNLSGWTLEPGETLDGTITVRISSRTPAGTYFDDVEVRSSCGSARTGPTAPVTVGNGDIPRVGGVERVETAIEVSREAFERADAAVLARSDDFPDALTASTLAVEIGGPILVNPPNALRDDVAAELERLGVKKVYLAGGEGALSQDVEDALVAAGHETRRLAGLTRYHTAALIADEVVALGGAVEQAIVARADLFPDSLTAANLAAWGRAPILLTFPTDPLHPETRDALAGNVEGDRVWIGGGHAAVGPRAEDDLRTEGYSTARLAGVTRYGTGIAFIEAARNQQAGVEPTLLASGHDFSDALVAGPAAHHLGGVVAITDPGTLENSPPTRDWFVTNADTIDTVLIVGGTSAVSDQVATEVAAIVR